MSKASFVLSESRWAINPGVLRPLIHAYADHLASRDYRPATIESLEDRARHFCFWLNQSGIDVSSIDGGVVEQFRLHQCQCPGNRPSGSLSRSYIDRVLQFVRFLEQTGVMHSPTHQVVETIDGRIPDYLEWLRRHRGLSEETIRSRRKLLVKMIPLLGPNASRYDAALIRRFIVDESRKHKPAHMKCVVTTLRSYLRFLVVQGECQSWLDQAVPTIAHWKHSNLPHYLPAGKVEQLIDSCDIETPAGLRDRAILLLLARLGLRARDIMKLRLSDIDWNEGTLQVCGKGRRSARLPLPQDAGDALLGYLNNARPIVSHEYVFLRMLAPYTPFANSHTVSSIVNRALTRAGITDAPSRGAHLLRHSAATSLLRSGETLATISTVLRHSSIDMTAHYAKVDVTALQQIAQPWPGGASC